MRPWRDAPGEEAVTVMVHLDRRRRSVTQHGTWLPPVRDVPVSATLAANEAMMARRARGQVTTGPGLARLPLDRYGAATLPASAFGEHPGALRLRLATGCSTGTPQNNGRPRSPPRTRSPCPGSTAPLTRLQEILADL